MIRKHINQPTQILLGIISVLLLVASYSLISYRQHISNPTDTTIPSILEIGRSFYKICTPDSNNEVWLLLDSKATFSRHLMGLFCGILLSVCLGVLMGCFPIIEYFLLPLMNLRWVAPTAMLAVFFVMVGTGTEMFVALITFGVTPVLTSAIYQAAKYDVPMELVNKAYTLGKSSSGVVFKVVIPQILPRIIEAVRLQLGPAMIYLIAAELYMGGVGFGYRLRIQSRLLNMSVVYDYLAVLAIVGYCFDMVLTKIRKWNCPWFK